MDGHQRGAAGLSSNTAGSYSSECLWMNIGEEYALLPAGTKAILQGKDDGNYINRNLKVSDKEINNGC